MDNAIRQYMRNISNVGYPIQINIIYCLGCHILVFATSAAKLLLFFDICKREGDFVLFLSLGHLSLFSRSSLGHGG